VKFTASESEMMKEVGLALASFTGWPNKVSHY